MECLGIHRHFPDKNHQAYHCPHGIHAPSLKNVFDIHAYEKKQVLKVPQLLCYTKTKKLDLTHTKLVLYFAEVIRFNDLAGVQLLKPCKTPKGTIHY